MYAHCWPRRKESSIEEHRRNRQRYPTALVNSIAVEEWLGLFDDPILGNSALDRLANASYQIVIEGESYRQRLSPHRALLEQKEVLDPPSSD